MKQNMKQNIKRIYYSAKIRIKYEVINYHK